MTGAPFYEKIMIKSKQIMDRIKQLEDEARVAAAIPQKRKDTGLSLQRRSCCA